MAKYFIRKDELDSFIKFAEDKQYTVITGSFANEYIIARLESGESRLNGANEYYFLYKRTKGNMITVDSRLTDLLFEYNDCKRASEEFK
jgi:hypothetical protein